MTGLKTFWVGLAGALLLGAGAATAQGPAPAAPKAAQPLPATAPATAAPAAHTLDLQDVDAWLDGYMPHALTTGNIAGAVVVVVKDGKVLTQRGFGVSDVATQAPVDPERTLFRPGSVSKLFTWTAVMQQVEAGKLDLDRDVNAYLDFRIPPRDGKPITLRNLMTHTAGFEEHAKHLFVPTVKQLKPLGDYLKAWVPARIFPPGEVPAYSNYGASLAGYIVQRVAGQEFDAYVAQHVFAPLGMTHSTFFQPLPAGWDKDMSKSYHEASGKAQPFEVITPEPAGSLASTGADMARFMLAHLNNGAYGDARILQAPTAQLMHAPAFAATPPLPGMALGFYHEDRNGHVIVGHAGDTESFHSDLHLFLNDGVGLFVSFNSLGSGGGAHTARTLLFREFADRYFPAASAPPAPTLASAKADGAVVAGAYVASRRMDSNFLRLAAFMGPLTAAVDKDGELTLSEMKAPGGNLEHWREIAPFVWQRVHGVERVAAVVKDGKVTALGVEGAPFEVFQPATGIFAPWNMTLLKVSLAILAATALLWPVTALVRWRYGHRFQLTGRSALLYRLVRGAAVADVVLVAAWLAILSSLNDITLLNDPINPWLRLVQLLSLVGMAGGVVGVLNLVQVWRDKDRSWWAKLSSVLLAVATVSVIWFVLGLRLITASLEF